MKFWKRRESGTKLRKDGCQLSTWRYFRNKKNKGKSKNDKNKKLLKAIKVEGKDPRDAIKEINAGVYDNIFKEERIELSTLN